MPWMPRGPCGPSGPATPCCEETTRSVCSGATMTSEVSTSWTIVTCCSSTRMTSVIGGRRHVRVERHRTHDDLVDVEPAGPLEEEVPHAAAPGELERRSR